MVICGCLIYGFPNYIFLALFYWRQQWQHNSALFMNLRKKHLFLLSRLVQWNYVHCRFVSSASNCTIAIVDSNYTLKPCWHLHTFVLVLLNLMLLVNFSLLSCQINFEGCLWNDIWNNLCLQGRLLLYFEGLVLHF